MGGDGTLIVAGTTIARGGFGVLLRGRSGCGKSDLALRALSLPVILPGEFSAQPFQLVSDDQTVVIRGGRGVIASAPFEIQGKLEVRGIGIVTMPSIGGIPLVLIADLTPGTVERMPEAAQEELLGVAIDVVQIVPFEASAPIKLGLALARAGRTLSPRA